MFEDDIGTPLWRHPVPGDFFFFTSIRAGDKKIPRWVIVTLKRCSEHYWIAPKMERRRRVDREWKKLVKKRGKNFREMVETVGVKNKLILRALLFGGTRKFCHFALGKKKLNKYYSTWINIPFILKKKTAAISFSYWRHDSMEKAARKSSLRPCSPLLEKR